MVVQYRLNYLSFKWLLCISTLDGEDTNRGFPADVSVVYAAFEGGPCKRRPDFQYKEQFYDPYNMVSFVVVAAECSAFHAYF